MKKVLVLTMTLLTIVACEKPIDDVEDVTPVIDVPSKQFTFTVKGDFGAATFKSKARRAYLQADGNEMTDLWVFDYVNGQLAQQVHQTADDEKWGQPQMALAYGSHHVYFVASRGDEPSLDIDGHTIIWATTRDTFWKDYEVEVVSTSNGNRAVTLDRVATKLRITINDEVPENCSSVSVISERWYYGIDYITGNAVSNQQKERTISVPASYIGTSGQLVMNFFGLSGSDEWTTNISVIAKDADGATIGQATIPGAPFKRNRSTEYSGNLFASGGGFDVSVNSDWENPRTGQW